jgi:hypothetical protein
MARTKSPFVIATLGRKSALACLVAGLALSASALPGTETIIERGFAKALEAPSATAGPAPRPAPVQVAGTEDFWLSAAAARHAPDLGSAVNLSILPASVTIGTTVDIAIDGQRRSFQVADISSLPAGVTRVGTSTPEPRLVVVALREAGKPNGALLRFVVEATLADNGDTVIRPARAL